MSSSLELRRRVVAATREMRARGLVCSTVGNVSARSAAGMLITPTRRHPAELEPGDLVHLDLDGRILADSPAAPSLEWRMHAAVYRARPDVRAIVHTHSPHATARSFDSAPLVVETEERVYFDLDRIEVAEAAPAGSEQLAQAAVRALGSRPAALLARHGVIGVGTDPDEALDICCLVEHQALIAGLVEHARRPEGPSEPAIRTRVRLPVDLPAGVPVEADVFTFTGLSDGLEHIAVGLGPYADVAVPLVRPHSECLTGDLFRSARCDCGPQLREAIERIHAHGGYLLYLRQEGRGIGLYNKLDAYTLQDNGLDTYQANRALGLPDDARDYRATAQMLHALDATSIDLLTNNPAKIAQLQDHGIHVRAVHATSAFMTTANARYLHTKATQEAHALPL